MPKLPAIKDRQLIKILLKLGFVEHAETGSSHLVFKGLSMNVLLDRKFKSFKRKLLKATRL